MLQLKWVILKDLLIYLLQRQNDREGEFFCLCVYVFVRERERVIQRQKREGEKEGDILICLFTPPNAAIARIEARGQELCVVLIVGWPGPSTLTTFCCFPRPNSKELLWKGSIMGSSQHSSVATGGLILQFHSAGPQNRTIWVIQTVAMIFAVRKTNYSSDDWSKSCTSGKHQGIDPDHKKCHSLPGTALGSHLLTYDVQLSVLSLLPCRTRSPPG